MKLFRIVGVSVLVLASLVLVGPEIQAAGVLDPACNQNGGAGSDSALCTDNNAVNKNNNPFAGNDGLFIKIANILTIIAGLAAVILIVLAGLRYITSSGGSEDVSGAKRTIIYAIVGLIIIALSRALVGLAISST